MYLEIGLWKCLWRLEFLFLISNTDCECVTQTVDVLTDIMSKCIVHDHGRTSLAATVVAQETTHR